MQSKQATENNSNRIVKKENTNWINFGFWVTFLAATAGKKAVLLTKHTHTQKQNENERKTIRKTGGT